MGVEFLILVSCSLGPVKSWRGVGGYPVFVLLWVVVVVVGEGTEEKE